jgi:hypothetical protein
MPTGQQYATNVPQTSLTSAITAIATSISVASSASWPSTPFTAVFALGQSTQEPIDVTNVSGTTWTITRAIDGTTAFAQAANTTITHADIGRDFREARAHIDASSTPDSTGAAVHGLASSSHVVGTTDTQILTNKTITSPSIGGTVAGGASYTSPSLTGTVGGGATYTTPTLDRPVIGSTLPSAPPAGDFALFSYSVTNQPSIYTPAGIVGSLIQPAADATLNGMLAWTTNPDAVTNNNFTIVQTTGQSLWTRFALYYPTPINSMWINVGTAGSGLTSGQNWGAIYDGSGNLKAQTFDQTTAWGTSGNKNMNINGGPITLQPGTYYAMLLVNYSSVAPGIAMVSYSSGGPDMNIGFSGAAPGRSNNLTTTHTTPPATVTLSTLSLVPTKIAFIGFS